MLLCVTRDAHDGRSKSLFQSVNLSPLMLGVMYMTWWAQVLRKLRLDKVKPILAHAHKHAAWSSIRLSHNLKVYKLGTPNHPYSKTVYNLYIKVGNQNKKWSLDKEHRGKKRESGF